ncbi:hypothetical protein MKW98_006577 [Papaver atlanticum]|uniref:TF-B3 domain-containing protein n=1 Tax=Papaver atlanticum TaxID=357466 RepID=A0AAD4T9J4_9MAGN|nr:hypothetical protein MKW98_006577 [Papaver atlanticum]
MFHSCTVFSACTRKKETGVMSFSSPFPFFWTCVKHFNDIRLTIPIKFVREHLPAKVTYPKSGEEKIVVLLQNEEGCSWELHVLGNVSRYIFSEGLKKFATDNNLKIDDYVIFELIDALPDVKLVMNLLLYIHRLPIDDDSDEDKSCYSGCHSLDF